MDLEFFERLGTDLREAWSGQKESTIERMLESPDAVAVIAKAMWPAIKNRLEYDFRIDHLPETYRFLVCEAIADQIGTGDCVTFACFDRLKDRLVIKFGKELGGKTQTDIALERLQAGEDPNKVLEDLQGLL